MTDEAHIEKLTALARRVWPDASVPVDVTHSNMSARVEVDDPRANGAIPLAFLCHPRALDALQAALLVLADEVPPPALYKINPDGTVERVEPPTWERERTALQERLTHAERVLGTFYQRVMDSTDYRDEMLELLKDYSERSKEGT